MVTVARDFCEKERFNRQGVMLMVRNTVRKVAIGGIGRVCDLSQFDTWFAYGMFSCRVLAVWMNTTSGLKLVMHGF
jgi:hypothetical protein